MENSGPSRFDELRAFGRYARTLPGFVRATITLEQARERIARQLARRSDSFLDLLDRAVYANPGSPYLRLLQAAGIELGDVRILVGERGLEDALRALREAGVYATLDEFKGRSRLERNGVSVPLSDGDFDNPLIAGHFWSTTGGSRGSSRRVAVDLGRMEHEAAYHSLFLTMFGLRERPFAVWRAIPPNRSGLNNCLNQVKSGLPVARWFNPYRPPRDLEALKYAAFTRYTVAAARLSGARIPGPEHCPPDRAAHVARWLAARTAEGRPAVVDTQVGYGVRACAAAREEGLDISGTFFRFGGEPLTEAKAEAVAGPGAIAKCHYSITEFGRVACACGEGSALDDMHVLSDKLAVLPQRRAVEAAGAAVDVLAFTSLLPTTSKIAINVESDDYAILERRECGCPFGELGMSLHVSRLRSHEKLTVEGIHFLGSDLYSLIDEVLPARFGGGPTDYQLVEEEVDGLPKLSVLVRPAVGEVDEEEVVSAALEFLRRKPRNRLMADVWAQSDTVRVVRREPHLTEAGKILPLHVGNST